MKKRLILGIAFSLIIISTLVVTACPGGTDTPTTDEQLATLSSRVSAIEGNIGNINLKAENDVVQWAQAQIVDIKNQIAALQSPTNYTPQINTINAEIAALESDIAYIETRLAVLEANGTAVPTADSHVRVAASLGLSGVNLHITSPYGAIVIFEVVFHPNVPFAVGLPGDAYGDVLEGLYAAPPNQCSAGTIILVPEFSLYHNPTDNTWYLKGIKFVTQSLTITAGVTDAVIMVIGSTFGSFVTAEVRELSQQPGLPPVW